MTTSLYRVVFAENPETKKKIYIELNKAKQKQTNKHLRNKTKKGWKMLSFEMVICQICNFCLVNK